MAVLFQGGRRRFYGRFSVTVKVVRNYIGGEWVLSKTGQFSDVRNPATGEVIGKCPLSSAEEVDQAVKAAREAFYEWRRTPPTARARCMFRVRTLMEDHFEELSRIVTMEAGKTLSEARAEMRRAFDVVDLACGIPSLMIGTAMEDVAKNIDCVAVKRPLGVFAAITPFNFPAMVPFWFWPVAVACGNTYILKSSEQSPLCMTRVFELLDEEGIFPPGVINMVSGSREVVKAICENPGISGVSFVGSTPVSQLVYARCAQTGKRVQSFGGAKNFMLIMPDADLEMTIPALMGSVYGCAGQRCLAASVVMTLGDIHDRFIAAMLEASKKLTVGDGLDETIGMGPLISEKQKQTVLGYIEKGLAEGATLLLDGRGVKVPGGENGYFVGPTVFDNVTPEMTIAREEIFGPVLSIMKVDSMEQAMEIMAASPFGNATSIFTSSGKAARDFVYLAESSMLGINIGVAAPMAFFPFGGIKGSFMGDIKAHGKEAVDFFTDRKVITTRW